MHQFFIFQIDFRANIDRLWPDDIMITVMEFKAKKLHTESFDWFLSSLESILDLEFYSLTILTFYQKLLWNIRSNLNSSTF